MKFSKKASAKFVLQIWDS